MSEELNMEPLRVALIGCGAVVERSHLPALKDSASFSVRVVADRDQSQAERVANTWQVPRATTNIEAAVDEFDIAVIATPSASHYEIGSSMLAANKHVLMEKPLATCAADARALVRLADERGLVLAVSLVRRYLPHFKLFRALLAAKVVGEVEAFSIAEGGAFNWPVQSGDFYDPARSGGGVLIDHGAHLLDACLWWLGAWQDVVYRDDANGGVEADCTLELELENGAKGHVVMSRLRTLSNEVVVRGRSGTLKMQLGSGEISLQPHGEHSRLVGQSEAPMPADTVALFEQQYQQLAMAIQDPGKASELVVGRECLDSIHLIEHCYKHRVLHDYAVWA